ncbi:MAG: glycosyltransferase family 4 protein [Clostridia bacterium]|nr:glycosyltransferase family 4 protein [Clostridia bacterium]
MDILVVCQYFSPEEFQINEICQELAKRHRVTVLTGLPNYPSGKVPDEYRHGQRRKEKIFGCEVLRCFEIGRGHGAAKLSMNYLSFALSGTRMARKLVKRHFDVVFVYQLSPVTMAYPALPFKRNGTPLCMYCCDLWPESLKAMIKGEGVLFQVMKRVSGRLYRACDRLIVQNEAFLAYLRDTHGADEKRVTVLPHFADDALLTLSRHEDNGVFDLVFLGNLGKAQGLDILLEAAAGIPNENLMLHFVGDGSEREALMETAARLGLENRARFHGRRPKDEMPDWYALADACALTLRKGVLADMTIPSKLQGYMAAGVQVLASVDGPAAKVIAESGCGLCSKAGDAALLRENLIRMISDAQGENRGRRGREWYKAHYTKKAHMERLEAVLEAAAKEGKNA